MEVNYQLVRPLFQKTIRVKTGDDVLLLFEQLKEHIRLNESTIDGLSAEEITAKRENITKGFFKGTMNDLIDANNFKVAQIIYEEYQKSGVKLLPEDLIVGLKINAF